MPPFAAGFISTILFALLSDKVAMRGPFIILGMTITIIGYIVLLTPQSFAVQYGIYSLLCLVACQADVVSCPSSLRAWLLSMHRDLYNVDRKQVRPVF